jgi:hypothetical protein
MTKPWHPAAAPLLTIPVKSRARSIETVGGEGDRATGTVKSSYVPIALMRHLIPKPLLLTLVVLGESSLASFLAGVFLTALVVWRVAPKWLP